MRIRLLPGALVNLQADNTNRDCLIIALNENNGSGLKSLGLSQYQPLVELMQTKGFLFDQRELIARLNNREVNYEAVCAAVVSLSVTEPYVIKSDERVEMIVAAPDLGVDLVEARASGGLRIGAAAKYGTGNRSRSAR